MTEEKLNIGDIQDLLDESLALMAFVRGFITHKSESKDNELYKDESFGCTQTIWNADEKIKLAYQKLEDMSKILK